MFENIFFVFRILWTFVEFLYSLSVDFKIFTKVLISLFFEELRNKKLYSLMLFKLHGSYKLWFPCMSKVCSYVKILVEILKLFRMKHFLFCSCQEGVNFSPCLRYKLYNADPTFRKNVSKQIYVLVRCANCIFSRLGI